MESFHKIRIKTPGRLHFGLIDLNGGLGRVDGGIGVAIAEPNIVVSAKFGENLEVTGTDRADEIINAVNKIKNYVNKELNINTFNGNININVEHQAPAHSGLGSTTQLRLAAAKAVFELNKITVHVREMSKVVGRGGTSGIGTEVLDGGHSFGAGKQKESFLPSSVSLAPPAPVLARYELPSDWYFVLVIPEVKSKIYGQREINIFHKYGPIPAEDVEKLSRLILMKILPAAVERDIESFGSGLAGMQEVGFKKIEVSLQNKIVVELIGILNKVSFGSGMSSFGPTVYALACGRKHADEVANESREFLTYLAGDNVKFEVIITTADNSGARIERF
jgi:beta-ribofuranosylaminobenzene 5'-phosphate synthase